MYKDIINDLIYVKPVSKDGRTDLQFNVDIKKIQKEYPIVDRTDKVNHSQRMKVSIVKYVLKIDSSEYKFSNYFLIFCA